MHTTHTHIAGHKFCGTVGARVCLFTHLGARVCLFTHLGARVCLFTHLTTYARKHA